MYSRMKQVEREWNSTQRTMPLPHRQLELKDEEGSEITGWFEGNTFYFNSGAGTGKPIVEWRYKQYGDH